MKRFLLLCAAACMLAAWVTVSVAQPIVTDGLTVFYDFDTFTDEVQDKSENNLHGVVLGNVVLSDDAKRGGGSAFFDSAPDFMETGVAVGGCDVGSEDACEAIPLEIIPRAGMTLAAWVKVEDTPPESHSIFQPRSADGSFVMHAQLETDGRFRMRLRGQLQADNINATERWYTDGEFGAEPYPIGEWFHMVTTYDMDADQIAFYYNGEKVVDISADGNAGAIELGDWGQAAIVGFVSDSRKRQFYGRMDEFYIFNRAITEQEVGLLYNLVEPNAPPELQAGDSDRDLDFDQLDLVLVQQGGKYLTGQAATWGEGDWNGAPGGSADTPPTGDGLFNQLDIIAALNAGKYLQGPYAAIANANGARGDGQTSIVYYPQTGEVAVDAPAGKELTSVNIESASGSLPVLPRRTWVAALTTTRIQTFSRRPSAAVLAASASARWPRLT